MVNSEPLNIDVLKEHHGSNWSIYHADCIDFSSQCPDECFDFSIYSPPFSNLYVYSESANDMGNSENDNQFFDHYKILLKELFRTTKQGRLSCVHCSDIPLFKWKDGNIGLKDFSGEIIKAHIDQGWIYHTRVTIWKDPVVEMQRTKALGLLHKQIKKDSSMCRVGMPDYLIVFRKPGENQEFIKNTNESFPVEKWQNWASPIWMDINQGRVLSFRDAKSEKDEKHICPLQLDVIERCLVLWSNPEDIVFSPFMGVGSEGYMSIKYNRKFIGTELKESYYKTAMNYLQSTESQLKMAI